MHILNWALLVALVGAIVVTLLDHRDRKRHRAKLAEIMAKHEGDQQ